MEMAQAGVKTRARAALAMEPASSVARTPKRRKISKGEKKVSTKRRSSSGVVEQKERCGSPISNDIPASCCSSNGSTGLDEERMKMLDLEVESAQVETSTCNGGEEIERREMSHSSELQGNSQEIESMEANSRRPLSTAQNKPTELELEEFFTTAEKDIQKRFQDKYNYDVVKDVPLEGRYEWIPLKP